MVCSWCSKQANKPIRAQEKSLVSRSELTGSLGIGALCSVTIILRTHSYSCQVGVWSGVPNKKQQNCYKEPKVYLLHYHKVSAFTLLYRLPIYPILFMPSAVFYYTWPKINSTCVEFIKLSNQRCIRVAVLW